jgi:hypothetical protein
MESVTLLGFYVSKVTHSRAVLGFTATLRLQETAAPHSESYSLQLTKQNEGSLTNLKTHPSTVSRLQKSGGRASGELHRSVAC